VAGSFYWVLSVAFPPEYTFVDQTIFGDEETSAQTSTYHEEEVEKNVKDSI
jgi:hypothetical protein